MPRRLLLYLSIFYVLIAWALNTVLAKQAVVTIDPMAFTFLRFLVMTPLAYALVYATRGRIRVRRRDIGQLLVCGACGFGLYQYCWILGLRYTTPFASSLLGATSPIFTLGIVAILGDETVRRSRWVGAFIAVVGVATFEGAFSQALGWKIGDILTIGAALVFAGYNVVSARLLERYSSLELLAIAMSLGTIMLVPGGVPALIHTDFSRIGWDVWWRLGYATIFPVLLTYPVWTNAISVLGAARVSIFSFLVPVLTGVLSVFILHTAFPPYQLAGAAICLCGMLIAAAKGSSRSLPKGANDEISRLVPVAAAPVHSGPDTADL